MENVSMEELERMRRRIIELAEAEKVPVKEVECVPGPSVSLFKVYWQDGASPRRLSGLQEALEFHGSSWRSHPVRVSKGMGCLEVEIPNEHQAVVPLQPLLETPEFKESEAELPLALGVGIGMKPRVLDLVQARHILIGGAAKQGKSVCLRSMMVSLQARKGSDELKFLLIDSALTSLPEATEALEALCREMESRLAATTPSAEGNAAARGEAFPYIVCLIDEYADLVLMKDFDAASRKQVSRLTESLFKLTVNGSTVGIHIILATQRPVPDIVTNLIKTQFPTRIAFRTSSRGDSERILGVPGAEKLLGDGDLLLSMGAGCERIQGAL